MTNENTNCVIKKSINEEMRIMHIMLISNFYKLRHQIEGNAYYTKQAIGTSDSGAYNHRKLCMGRAALRLLSQIRTAHVQVRIKQWFLTRGVGKRPVPH